VVPNTHRYKQEQYQHCQKYLVGGYFLYFISASDNITSRLPVTVYGNKKKQRLIMTEAQKLCLRIKCDDIRTKRIYKFENLKWKTLNTAEP
jgi:hypothetical protein